ncbi:DNA-binding response regulator, OmpR family, contains REC and winged-helix (wHTH) domain [Paenibacillus catalpae]|uniref:DNA-binding response regulator, OmpR family, contains REC and winged-helix (WHTH) domain n=1 Tax=Paenibacillus catalpae TaxID=1045775 RepID=A0A1I2DP91_9BACL|nr:response regulator transcription factor [Paenibacillus catalpae]SFE82151.1 DNA-binding response regulator, OmpR family, contains REC and winged-helix (wHTH) domain [Paenibacillus catalpae]
MGACIVVADDERNITDVCRRYLEREGHQVWVAENGEEAIRLWKEHQPDLLVLDLMMPKVDGLEVCDTIRQTDDTPIIMLTARGEEPDRLLGLTMGADDYMTKPFSPRELVLRINNILRRMGRRNDSSCGERDLGNKPLEEALEGKAIHFEGLSIFPQERRVAALGFDIELTVKEFDLLQLLATYPGKVFSRSQLLNQVWDMAYDGDTTTVTVHVRRLREKIEPNPSDPTWIKTVWGIGYKLDNKGNTT